MSHDLQALVPPGTYRESRAHLFPGPQSFDWFMRQNRKRLVDAGALVVIAGRNMIHQTLADEVVMAVGRETAQRHKAAA